MKSKMFQICERPKKHLIKSKMFEYCRIWEHFMKSKMFLIFERPKKHFIKSKCLSIAGAENIVLFECYMIWEHCIKSKMFQICKRPKKHLIKSKMFEYCRSCQEAAIRNTPCYSPCLTSTYTPLFLS